MSNYPEFFDTIEPILVQDPLARILGAFENGEYEIPYIEVVKAAGHSCPTVAGAYLMTQKALHRLYDGGRAVRGDIEVEFGESLQEGVAGVVANVVSHITGATDKSGFKGLGGKFARHSLMYFERDIQTSARFTRKDTQQSVEVIYDHSMIATDPQMKPLMQKMMMQEATPQELKRFGEIWQSRVAEIFKQSDKVLKVL